MNTSNVHFQQDPVEQVLEEGLKDLWYPVCPSGFVQGSPVSLRTVPSSSSA